MTGGAVWLNETLYDTPPPLSRDRGLLLGDGLFETILVRRGSPVLLSEHLDRMRRSAAALSFPPLPALEERLERALKDLLASVNEPGPTPLMAFRVTLTRGPGPRGLVPSATQGPSLFAQLDPYDPAAVSTETAVVIEAPRIDPLDPVAPHKTTSALRWIFARQAARAAGADVAILRTIDGDLAEADFANLFAVVDGRVVTPPLDRGLLPGVTRAFVLHRLGEEGRPGDECPLHSADLDRASETFITSSLIGVRSLRRIDGKLFTDPSPVADALATAYEALG